MAPSQLSQLKSALSTAGLSRQSNGKKSGGNKSSSKAGLTNKDREKKQRKLDDIKQSLNKFDVRETKVKNHVVGRGQDVKGTSGTPSQSRQKGLEMRRETLLPELQLRRSGHTGTFVDRRFGESNPNITPEERALERFTRARDAERGSGGRAGKKSVFNLNDDESAGLGFGDDDGELHLGSKNAGFTLTHGGRTIDELKGDDFAAQGLGDDDDGELDDDFGINREVEGEEREGDATRRNNFGGFGDDAGDDDPDRKRSKAEIMSEVIAKSKSYKLERQQQKELDEDIRMELDEGLDDLRALLNESIPSNIKRGKANLEFYKAPAAKDVDEDEEKKEDKKEGKTDGDYDQFVRSLAFDRRAKPKDRTKTEEEVAKEEAEKLRDAEIARLKRMRGEEDDDEDDEGGVRKRKRSKGGRAPEADDLDDDYEDGYEDDDAKEFGLEGGLGSKTVAENDDEADEDEDSEMEDDEDEDEDGEEDDDLESGEEDEEDDLASDLELEEEIVGKASSGANGETKSSKKSRSKTSSKPGEKAIPFTFKCPENYDEFEAIIDGLKDTDVETVVKRIRTLYHPSLGEGNKERLQELLGILLEHIINRGSESNEFALVSLLMPHINALVNLNVLSAAEMFKEKLAEMHAILLDKLEQARLDDKTMSVFPETGDLAILRMIGTIWSTSDFSHPVSVPAALYMGQVLSQAPIRSLADLAKGLFMSAIFLQYETYSQRIVPEAINFLATAILALAPPSFNLDPIPGTFPLRKDARELGVYLKPKSASKLLVRPADLPTLMDGDHFGKDYEQDKVDTLALALRLMGRFAEMQKDLPGFIESFEPFYEVVFALSTTNVPASIKTVCEEENEKLGKLIGISSRMRRPLEMQTHKAIPIPQYAPKFEAEYSRGKRVDPDAERNEAAKIKALYKKERKGAIRELRKDAKFLAVERNKERKEKDVEYEKRMRSVVGSITTTERAEEKAAEREKARDKRRGGRN